MNNNIIILMIFATVWAWSIWFFDNFPQETPIGYMECYKEGTGPWSKCGEMEVRCYSKRGGRAMTCPFFENIDHTETKP